MNEQDVQTYTESVQCLSINTKKHKLRPNKVRMTQVNEQLT